METNKNIGFIECGARGGISGITSNNNLEGYTVKKVMTTNNIPHDVALSQFPEAQLVDDIKSIIQDSAIDLILVSKPKQTDLSIIGEAVQAGKSVRIIS